MTILFHNKSKIIYTIYVSFIISTASSLYYGNTNKAYANEETALSQACDNKDAEACDKLGTMFDEGNKFTNIRIVGARFFDKECIGKNIRPCAYLPASDGENSDVKKDLVQAAKHYQKACELEYLPSCYKLGSIYMDGEGGAKNNDEKKIEREKARALLKKTCDGGYLLGCNLMAISFWRSGRTDEAYDLFQKSCEGGIMSGCAISGNMHLSKSLAGKDLPKASSLLQKACDGENFWGCNALALLYANDTYGIKDSDKSISLFETACEGGFLPACTRLADAYKTGENVAADQNKAKELYQKICDGGQDHACELVKELDAQMKTPDKSTDLCNANDLAACLKLGKNYEYGNGVAKDEAKGASLYKMACDLDSMEGCFNLAYMSQHGIGIEKDAQQAKALYKKACDGGWEMACSF